MKTTNIFFITTIILILFSACDKIEPPFTEGCANCCGEANINEPIKRILVEEFTGHKCSNCPNATRILDNLSEIYCDHLVIVACHPTNQDFTEPNEFGPLSTDFRKEECAEIGNEFGFWGFPSALINRKNTDNNYFLFTSEWGAVIDNLLFDSNGEKKLPDLYIDINYEITDFDNKSIELQVFVNYLNQLSGNYNLVVLITENNIISGQYDGDELIENYVHNHVYRSAVNGAWGEPIENNLKDLTVSTIEKNYSFTFNSLNNINWDNQWNNIDSCSIVAYVYDTETNEIIQASERKINLTD